MAQRMVQTSNGNSMPLVNLVEYLRRMKNLEALKYEQQCAINRLSRKIRNVDSEKQQDKYHEDVSETLIGGILLCFLGPIFTLLGLHIIWAILAIVFWIIDAQWADEVLDVLVLINIGIAVIVFFYCIYTTISDVKKIKEQNKRIDRENAKIRRENANSRERIQRNNEAYTREISILKNRLAQTNAMIQKGYAFNVIHKKYRGLIAIHSIYEYFETGRCFTLLGHEGAYNILEEDIKYKVILNKLDIIISKLDEIKDTQSQLYNTIVSSENHINSLQNQVERCISNNSVANESLQRIQYNTQISAYNTEYLKWLETFRY